MYYVPNLCRNNANVVFCVFNMVTHSIQQHTQKTTRGTQDIDLHPKVYRARVQAYIHIYTEILIYQIICLVMP